MFKYRIDAGKSTSSELLPTESFARYFLTDIIDSADAHATYRYLLINEETGKPELLVMIGLI